jgi:hypothetical protein
MNLFLAIAIGILSGNKLLNFTKHYKNRADYENWNCMLSYIWWEWSSGYRVGKSIGVRGTSSTFYYL